MSAIQIRDCKSGDRHRLPRNVQAVAIHGASSDSFSYEPHEIDESTVATLGSLAESGGVIAYVYDDATELFWRSEVAAVVTSHECAYCHATIDGDSGAPPSAGDSAAWEALAAQHHSACEWVETRAHRA